jgi:hypothetical protein
MPPLPPVPNVIKLELMGTLSGSNPWANILYFQWSGTALTIDMNTWMTAVANSWGTNFAPYTSPNYVLTSLKAVDLTSSSGAASFIITNKPGTDASQFGPSNATVTVRHYIPRRYRGGHPKTFLVCGDPSQLVNNTTWSSSFISTMQTKWNAFMAACEVTSGALTINTHVNVSFYQGFHNVTEPSGRQRSVPTPRSTPLVDQVTSSVVQTQVGSQRRRLR